MYYFNIFFIFSIFGHFLENFFYTSKDSGILYGYWTPIYGFGVIIIISTYNYINKKFKLNKLSKFITIFLIGTLLLSLIEIIGGYLIEIIFNKTFWDYSNHKYNIGKYTSLEMSIIWGISSLILIYLLKPLIDKIERYIPKLITAILIILFVIDSLFTILPHILKK